MKRRRVHRGKRERGIAFRTFVTETDGNRGRERERERGESVGAESG